MTCRKAYVTNGLSAYGSTIISMLINSGWQIAADPLEGLDLLVCIPEISDEAADIPITMTQNEQMKKAYNIIYKDTLLHIKEASLYMREHGGGSIVIMTNAEGLRASKYDYLAGSMYAALHRSIESFALQLAPYGIRINCIAPGNVRPADDNETSPLNVRERFPMNRPGTMEEIAEAVLFLGSDKASYITGITLRCDGGSYLAGMPEKNDWYGWDKP